MKAVCKDASIPKENIMKRIPTLSLIILAALSAIPAIAQGVVLKADVPFGFNVGDTYMPAGHYTLSSPDSGIVRVANNDSNAAATVSTIHGNTDPGHGSKLVFEKFGDRYFLHGILCPTTVSLNVNIPSWKAEKRARSQEAKLDRGETILIAAR
jgi:hypothetical protein